VHCLHLRRTSTLSVHPGGGREAGSVAGGVPRPKGGLRTPDGPRTGIRDADGRGEPGPKVPCTGTLRYLCAQTRLRVQKPFRVRKGGRVSHFRQDTRTKTEFQTHTEGAHRTHQRADHTDTSNSTTHQTGEDWQRSRPK
jgi:hypothetical protein